MSTIKGSALRLKEIRNPCINPPSSLKQPSVKLKKIPSHQNKHLKLKNKSKILENENKPTAKTRGERNYPIS
jgi:hypothetical protein